VGRHLSRASRTRGASRAVQGGPAPGGRSQRLGQLGYYTACGAAEWIHALRTRKHGSPQSAAPPASCSCCRRPKSMGLRWLCNTCRATKLENVNFVFSKSRICPRPRVCLHLGAIRDAGHTAYQSSMLQLQHMHQQQMVMQHQMAQMKKFHQMQVAAMQQQQMMGGGGGMSGAVPMLMPTIVGPQPAGPGGGPAPGSRAGRFAHPQQLAVAWGHASAGGRHPAEAQMGMVPMFRRAVAEPPPMTAEKALRQAEAEGLALLRSGSNASGYKGVAFNSSLKSKPYQAKVRRGGRQVFLGCFATAEEAALCYARSPEGQAAAAAPPEPPPTAAEQALRQAETEGLTLLRSESGSTGYRGVSFDSRAKSKPYKAEVRRGGKKVHLGYNTTPEEAALHVARDAAAHTAAQQPPAASSRKRKVSSEEQPPDVSADVVVILDGRFVDGL